MCQCKKCKLNIAKNGGGASCRIKYCSPRDCEGCHIIILGCGVLAKDKGMADKWDGLIN